MFSLVLAGTNYLLVHLSLRCWAAIANLITAQVALGACAQVSCLILNLNKKLTSRDLFITICDVHALQEKRHSFQPPLPPSPLLLLILRAVALCKSAIIITPFPANSFPSCQASVPKWGFSSLHWWQQKPNWFVKLYLNGAALFIFFKQSSQ